VLSVRSSVPFLEAQVLPHSAASRHMLDEQVGRARIKRHGTSASARKEQYGTGKGAATFIAMLLLCINNLHTNCFCNCNSKPKVVSLLSDYTELPATILCLPASRSFHRSNASTCNRATASIRCSDQGSSPYILLLRSNSIL